MLPRPSRLQRARQSGVMGRAPRPPSVLLGLGPATRPALLAAAAPPVAETAAAPRQQQQQQQQQPPSSRQRSAEQPPSPRTADPTTLAVPSTLPDLVRGFFAEPSILLASGLIASAAGRRLALLPSSPPHAAEAALCLGAVALWSVSEWLIHRYLLHPDMGDDEVEEDGGKAGGSDGNGSSSGRSQQRKLDPVRDALRATHEQHHARPYLHVSVDGPGLIAAFMLGTGLLWLAGFALCGAFSGGAGGTAAAGAGAGAEAFLLLAVAPLSSPLFFSALTAYWSAGLLYEFVHYAVHTRYVPKGGSWPARYLRAVRRHHILHHCRSERHWLAFTVPQVDALFGTLPGAAAGAGGSGGRLPAMTPMARRAAQSWRAGGG